MSSTAIFTIGSAKLNDALFEPVTIVRLGWNGWHYTAFKGNANRAGCLLYRIWVRLERSEE
ncbi:hypothetical protein amad1_09000 [Alteromonas mediterranea DE1]|uniref:Uncharacterized protein n=2 Tax=Alteromonas mediterranea TaxID=314275 RepID=A0AAC8XJ65_9ALTE|nr:hypothetical protein amad1_09000 [Alteromonas mediterranea DE1]AGP97322.1 hypothetical protein I635_08990 [Alteromonas mediterranea UM7]AGQ01598.1 hypothetical protein I636_08720 [Alteromonas mediterranea UM4b]AGV54020.1 hypothetical protein MADE_000001021580 [Alteromonas mediterranea DE]AMJ78405.1 hypothetical protein AV942_08920 [Alteromonas mediterranea]